MEMQLNWLKKDYERLDKAVAHLREKIDGVMKPSPDAENKEPVRERKGQSIVVGRLEEMHDSFARITSRLERFVEAIEL